MPRSPLCYWAALPHPWSCKTPPVESATHLSPNSQPAPHILSQWLTCPWRPENKPKYRSQKNCLLCFETGSLPGLEPVNKATLGMDRGLQVPGICLLPPFQRGDCKCVLPQLAVYTSGGHWTQDLTNMLGKCPTTELHQAWTLSWHITLHTACLPLLQSPLSLNKGLWPSLESLHSFFLCYCWTIYGVLQL